MTERQGQVKDEYGRAVPGAEVYVFTDTGISAALTIDGTVPLIQPVTTNEFGLYAYFAANGLYREDIYFGGRLYASDIVGVGVDGIYPASPRAGKFFAFDADEAPVTSSGTGADAGLRTDLAATTGGQLVGRKYAGSVQDYIDKTPRRLHYVRRQPLENWRQVDEAVDTLHEGIVGFAGDEVAGTTGGLGKPVVYVKDPSLSRGPMYSLGRAIDVAAANDGAFIAFDPDGSYPVILADRIDLGGIDNLTLWAPGRNVTVWCDRLLGALRIAANNHLYQTLSFRPTAGPINGTAIGEDESSARSLIVAVSDVSDKLAFVGCEFRHPSWHCLDIATSKALTGASPQCRATIQQCIFWSAIQSHLLGTNNSSFQKNGTPEFYTDDTSVRQTFVTIYQSIYAYVLQRNPKVLGNAFVDMADCLLQLAPYPVEYTDGFWNGVDHTFPEIHTSAWGAGVQEGGHLLTRGVLFQSTHPTVDGRPATFLSTEGYSTNTGWVKVEDCAVENGLVLNQRNPELVEALPYTLPHTPVPASGAAREAWVDNLWALAGARVDSAPIGEFVVKESPEEIPDGESILLDDRTDRTRYLMRVDPLSEYHLPNAYTDAKGPTFEAQATSRILGKAKGSGSGAAAVINPAALDVTDAPSGYFQISPGTGSIVRHVVADNLETDDGAEYAWYSSSGAPTTIRTALVLTASVASLADNTLTVTGHGEPSSGFPVVMSNSGGALPAGLATLTRYYAVYVDANTIKLTLTLADALAGTNIIDITGNGTGTHKATIGSFDLPGGRDILLNSSSKIVSFRMNKNTWRFSLDGAVAADSGAYTPTITGITNVAAATVNQARYFRVGDEVLVRASLQITPTASAADTVVNVSLPIASDLTLSGDVSGTGALNSNLTTSKSAGPIYGSPGTDGALYRFVSTNTTSGEYSVIFSYTVK